MRSFGGSHFRRCGPARLAPPALALALLAGCFGGATEFAVPAGIHPRLPLPEATRMEAVAGERFDRDGDGAADGIFLPDEEYRRTLRMIQGMRAENDLIRQTVTAYNEWAERKWKEAQDGGGER